MRGGLCRDFQRQQKQKSVNSLENMEGQPLRRRASKVTPQPPPHTAPTWKCARFDRRAFLLGAAIAFLTVLRLSAPIRTESQAVDQVNHASVLLQPAVFNPELNNNVSFRMPFSALTDAHLRVTIVLHIPEQLVFEVLRFDEWTKVYGTVSLTKDSEDSFRRIYFGSNAPPEVQDQKTWASIKAIALEFPNRYVSVYLRCGTCHLTWAWHVQSQLKRFNEEAGIPWLYETSACLQSLAVGNTPSEKDPNFLHKRAFNLSKCFGNLLVAETVDLFGEDGPLEYHLPFA